jgi:hypothetical protein
MRVRELMQDDVISVNQDTRINDAVVTLTDARISALPVLDGGGRMVYADVRGTLDPILADTHDRWMAEADKIIGAVTEPDAIFMQRWAAVRYVWDELPVQLQMQQELLKELHPFIPAEIRERLSMQLDRLHHLHRDLDSLARRTGTARELARTARALLEALRLWYGEIKFAVGEIELADLGYAATSLLERLTGRPRAGAGWVPGR